MSKSKKPRKRYNPAKTRTRYYDHFADKLVLESWDSDQEPGQPATFSCTQPQHILEYAVSTPKRWLVESIVKCETETGERYWESREIVSSTPVRVNDLTDFAIEQLDEAEASVNPKHIVDRGWKAQILTPALEQKLAKLYGETA